MLFESESINIDENEAIDYLRKMGYTVIPPTVLEKSSVSSPASLVDFFYSYLQFCNPNRRIHYTMSSKRDLKHAKKFIESRSCCANSGKKRALLECVNIIKCVIENESLFGFSEPLHSLDYFGQDNMKWVTDKAICIINRENEEIDRAELDVFTKELYSSQEKSAISKIDNKINELKNILGGLDGKK